MDARKWGEAGQGEREGRWVEEWVGRVHNMHKQHVPLCCNSQQAEPRRQPTGAGQAWPGHTDWPPLDASCGPVGPPSIPCPLTPATNMRVSFAAWAELTPPQLVVAWGALQLLSALPVLLSFFWGGILSWLTSYIPTSGRSPLAESRFK